MIEEIIAKSRAYLPGLNDHQDFDRVILVSQDFHC